jgi:hypothetical protein
MILRGGGAAVCRRRHRPGGLISMAGREMAILTVALLTNGEITWVTGHIA